MKKLIIITSVVLSIFLLSYAVSASTLLTEDWEGGIDLSVWRSWGSPTSTLESGPDSLGLNSFRPNGDSNYESGVVSLNSFDVTPGLQVSFSSMRRRITTHYNFNVVSLTTSDPTTFGNSTAFYHGRIGPYIMHSGETANGVGAKLADGNPWQNGVNVISESSIGEWIDYMFQFNADGSVGYFQNGILAHTTEADFIDYATAPDVHLVVAGRGNGLMESISVTQAVPEPASMLLIGSGLAGLLGLRRKK